MTVALTVAGMSFRNRNDHHIEHASHLENVEHAPNVVHHQADTNVDEVERLKKEIQQLRQQTAPPSQATPKATEAAPKTEKASNNEIDNPLLVTLKPKEGEYQPKDKNIHIIFSSSCSLFQGWQSELLFFSAMHVKQPGRITRLVSACHDKLLKGNETTPKPNFVVDKAYVLPCPLT